MEMQNGLLWHPCSLKKLAAQAEERYEIVSVVTRENPPPFSLEVHKTFEFYLNLCRP